MASVAVGECGAAGAIGPLFDANQDGTDAGNAQSHPDKPLSSMLKVTDHTIPSAAPPLLTPELLREVGDLRYFIFAVGLLLIMLFRPSGIWPARGKR